MNWRKIRVRIAMGIGAFFLIGMILAALVWFGVIQLNGWSARQFEVRGVDVSEYQGEIDWEILAEQDIQFAFIKATEGSSYQDPQFEQNWMNAAKTDLRIGAYHFFSFDSGGETQAQLFIDTVEPVDQMLPPVVDVEYYGDYRKNPPDRDRVQAELSVMLEELEEAYGVKPILYVTYDTLWVCVAFHEYDYWQRDVYNGPPGGDKGRLWRFWQYTNREVLDGYDGEERYIDCNVYSGSAESFAQYGLS